MRRPMLLTSKTISGAESNFIDYSKIVLQVLLAKQSICTGSKMSKSNSMFEKASGYDKTGLTKREVDNALVLLKEFRMKFPFSENPQSIDWLEPEKILKQNSNEIGEFFHYILYSLNPLGPLTIQNSNVYQNIRTQITVFKNLLRTAVDRKKSLAEKVDAPWEKINGLGQDKHIAKKIIFCFNYESRAVLPIFSTPHLRHFVNRVVEDSKSETKYYSLGQEYAQYTSELLKAKENLPITRGWETSYFARFLYYSYPPPDSEPPTTNPSGEGKTINVVTNEQLELRAFVKLLGELQSKGKITGQQFRENRELWLHQQPNDRDVLIWRLKQLLTTETKIPRNQSDEPPKKPTRQKL
jgi:hypothetical protein